MTARRQPVGDNVHMDRSSKNFRRNLPLFAQPLNGSKFPEFTTVNGRSNRGHWSRPAVWGLAVITCGVLLALARPNDAQNLPASRSNASVTRTNSHLILIAQARTTPTSKTPVSDLLAEPREENRRSVEFYTQAVRGNMFNAPQPPAPPVVKAPAPAPAPKPDKPVVVPLPPINPFADWSYTGTITSGDQVTALIENTKTKEGQFVKTGDNFMGSQVTAITDQQIILKSGKTSQALAKSDNITVTPLDRSAIPTTGAQTAAQQPAQNPNMPQAMQMQMQMPNMDVNAMRNMWRNRFGGGGNGQTFSLPNGRTFNPQQWQNRSQRMNRNFDR